MNACLFFYFFLYENIDVILVNFSRDKGLNFVYKLQLDGVLETQKLMNDLILPRPLSSLAEP